MCTVMSSPAIGRTHDGDGGDATGQILGSNPSVGSARIRGEWRQAPVDFTVPPVRHTFETLECTCRRGEADHLVMIAIGGE